MPGVRVAVVRAPGGVVIALSGPTAWAEAVGRRGGASRRREHSASDGAAGWAVMTMSGCSTRHLTCFRGCKPTTCWRSWAPSMKSGRTTGSTAGGGSTVCWVSRPEHTQRPRPHVHRQDVGYVTAQLPRHTGLATHLDRLPWPIRTRGGPTPRRPDDWRRRRPGPARQRRDVALRAARGRSIHGRSIRSASAHDRVLMHTGYAPRPVDFEDVRRGTAVRRATTAALLAGRPMTGTATSAMPQPACDAAALPDLLADSVRQTPTCHRTLCFGSPNGCSRSGCGGWGFDTAGKGICPPDGG